MFIAMSNAAYLKTAVQQCQIMIEPTLGELGDCYLFIALVSVII